MKFDLRLIIAILAFCAIMIGFWYFGSNFEITKKTLKVDSTVIELDTVKLHYFDEDDIDDLDSLLKVNNKLLRELLINQNQQKDNIDHIKMLKNRKIVDSLLAL